MHAFKGGEKEENEGFMDMALKLVNSNFKNSIQDHQVSVKGKIKKNNLCTIDKIHRKYSPGN